MEDTGGERAAARSVEALYRAELSRVVRLAFLLTGDRAAAEEIGQETFVRLIPRFDGLRSPEAFLTTVTVNLCRDWGRRETTASRHRWSRPGAVHPPDLPRDVGELWLAVQRLPHHHREVVVLHYWADLPSREVARLLGIGHGAARSLLHRAIASLKKELTDGT